jgi:hypothetical protein
MDSIMWRFGGYLNGFGVYVRSQLLQHDNLKTPDLLRHVPKLMSDSERFAVMSIPCSTLTYPRTDAWALELYGLLDKSELEMTVPVERSEMMSRSPLPWPVTPYDEWASEREMMAMAEMASFNAKQYEMYGDDQELVMSLMCDETEVDISLALWRWKRVEELQQEVTRFFELFEEGRFGDALHLGWWLLEQHDKYGASYDPALLRLLKETMSKAFEEKDIIDSFAGDSLELPDI